MSTVTGFLIEHYMMYIHCHRKQKRGQTERPPVYEDVQTEMKADIELQHNEVYGQINH